MSQLKLDRLENLKYLQDKLKLKQKKLAAEIEVEIHKQFLLEQSGTIIKLKTQIDLLRASILKEQAPNNNILNVLSKQRNLDFLEKQSDISNENIKRIDILKKQISNSLCLINKSEPNLFNKPLISIREYYQNIENCKDILYNINKKPMLSNIAIDERLYDNSVPKRTEYVMVPILTTILGILDRQEKSIEYLTKKIENLKI